MTSNPVQMELKKVQKTLCEVKVALTDIEDYLWKNHFAAEYEEYKNLFCKQGDLDERLLQGVEN